MKATSLFVGSLLLFAGGLVRAGVVADGPSLESSKSAGAKPAAASQGKTPAKTYRLRNTDVISVDIVDDARASREYKLGLDGTVKPIYLSQPVKLAGLSVAEAEAALSAAYVQEKIFTKPQIALTIKEYAPRQIYFLGEVNHPGAIPIPPENELSLVAAFSLAGGNTPRAKRTCTITRLLPDGKSTELKMDLRAAVEDAKKDIMLEDGDTVFIGQSLLDNEWY